MNKKYLDIIRFCFIFLMCLGVLLFLYVMMEGVSDVNKKTTEVNKELLDDAFIMGAAMYRAQVVKTLDDSTIVKLDSLFIQEVRDFNDTLVYKVREEIE